MIHVLSEEGNGMWYRLVHFESLWNLAGQVDTRTSIYDIVGGAMLIGWEKPPAR